MQKHLAQCGVHGDCPTRVDLAPIILTVLQGRPGLPKSKGTEKDVSEDLQELSRLSHSSQASWLTPAGHSTRTGRRLTPAPELRSLWLLL